MIKWAIDKIIARPHAPSIELTIKLIIDWYSKANRGRKGAVISIGKV